MSWHTIVTSAVGQAIGRCALSRAGVVQVLTSLHNTLPLQADSLRLQRAAPDPDYFVYYLMLRDSKDYHFFDFLVDDVSAPGFLFVEAVRHTP